MGAYAKEKGISRLLATGSATRETVQAFGYGASHFENVEDLASQAAGAASLLVKGSRFMRMDRVVSMLTGTEAGGH